MIKIIAPATSANLGPGFDSLGIAFELYNVFEVEKSKEFIVTGCPKKFQNEDNLFIQAFKKVTSKANKRLKCKVDIKANIPLERGLGSSASLICAGLVAANELLAKPFSKDGIKEKLDMVFINNQNNSIFDKDLPEEFYDMSKPLNDVDLDNEDIVDLEEE